MSLPKPRTTWTLLFAVILSAGILALAPMAGCSRDKFEPPPTNKAPHVRVTGGPPTRPDGELVRDVYTVKIFWHGWDDDGTVAHFLYAIDIDRTAIDMNPITGNSDGNPLPEINDPRSPITWTRLDGFERSFLFSASVPDSSLIDQQPIGTSSGAHTFYIRAVDDQGGLSDVDFLSFTATTVAPKTRILSPEVTGDVASLTVGTDVHICWEGVDEDSPSPRKTPLYYEYKLITMFSIFQYAPFEIQKDPSPWIRVGADTTCIRFENLEAPRIYAFAVRAVDEAGAVEPFLDEPRNVIKFQVLQTAGFPYLTIRESALGTIECSGSGSDPVIFEVPVGIRLRFEMTGDAKVYGSSIGGYNWGVDLVDPSREDPESGWRGWSSQNFTDNFPVFTKAGTHFVYLRTRDTGTPPKQSMCTIRLEYIDFPKDRGILYIDDSFTARNPSDEYQDALFRSALDTAITMGKTDRIDVFESYGPGDAMLEVTPLTLRILSRYQLVVWNTSGAGRSGSGISAWRRATTGISVANQRILPSFLKAGGQVWISGTRVVGASIVTTPPYPYPHDETTLKSGTFPYDFFHFCTSKLDMAVVTSLGSANGMIGALPCGAGAEEGYPRLDVDPNSFRTTIKTFGESEAVFAPMDPTCPAVDTLYCYVALGPTVGKVSSFDGRPTAFLVSSAEPGTELGRAAVFLFPLDHFELSGMKALCARLFEWFSFDAAPAAPRS